MNEYNQVKVGRRIRKLRNKKGFTIEKFAELADLSTSFVWEFETGKKGLSVKSIYFIAQVLGVSIDFLVTGKEINIELDSIIELISDCTPSQLESIRSIICSVIRLSNER